MSNILGINDDICDEKDNNDDYESMKMIMIIM